MATHAAGSEGTGRSDAEPPEAQSDRSRPVGDVDYRFTLANERTFLAWIRTSLALLAGGLAVRELVSTFDVGWARTALAVACILLSVAVTVLGYRQWLMSQQAMRAGEPLPRSPGVPLLSAGVVLVAITATLLVVIG